MVESKLLTLDDIIREQFLFNVPIYQRLYVWGEDQIRVLMEDLQGAFEERSVFYLGGALVIERPLRGRHRSRRFDLIDGQQRFTTLWLISIVCNILASEDPDATNCLSDYRMQKVGGSFWPRISFAIRPEVEQFFKRALAGELTSMREAVNLENAINKIQGYLRDKALDIGNFTYYLRTNVKMVVTEVPAETDLNKLFEIINNRGLQLQHHDILKARLLEKLRADERDRYGRLWDACANMDDYVERNLRNVTGLKLVRLFDSLQARDDGENLARASSVLSALSRLVRKGERETLSLKDILESDAETDQPRQPQTEGGHELLRVRSIITFPMLLQHVLRIHLLRNSQEDVARILDKDLLRIFQQSWLRSKPASDEVRKFIELLWEVRYRFDKHIIKWIHNDDEEIHAIRRLRIIKGDNGPSVVFDSYGNLHELFCSNTLLRFALERADANCPEDRAEW